MNLSQFGVNFEKINESIKNNWKLMLSTVIVMLVVLAIICFATFFMVVKSPEKVMVPDIVGEPLTDALQEMQAKELYPKITLRFSESPDTKGDVLEQNPIGGAIVKAGRRIELVVSNGAVLDQVEDYVGQSLDEVRAHMQTLFASTSRPMISLPDVPVYQEDEAEAGIILSQNPPPGTDLVEPITLDLIVSSGPGNKKVTIPYLVGMTLADVHVRMSRTKLIFQFTGEIPDEDTTPGSVISQKWPEEGELELPLYSTVSVVLAIPEEPVDDMIYGIYEETLPPYPYALDVSLDATTEDGETYNVVEFKHPGGEITIPYSVTSGTKLVLSVLGKQVSKKTVE
ncbi:MAG: penicillin-binding protein [Treponema sp. CETP13]|nr:MAG: penicillin-binding protein [Treponema sp. CETP13]